VFPSQLFGKRGRYNLPANEGLYIDMLLVVLASVRRHKGIGLHFGCCCFNNGYKRGEG
jgi:hypothetical protein